MKILSLLIVASFYLYEVASQFNPICRGKRYMCDSDNVITDPDVCMMVNDTKNKLHLIKPCESEDKPICNFANINYTNPAKCEAAPPAELTYPGESCTKNSQCHSGLCVNGVCKGKGFNETCTDDYDCDAGYYCSDWDKKCKEQRQFGENCTRDFDCTNNCVCNRGICVYYYSFDNFLAADNPKACTSGYIKNGKCYPALKSVVKGRPCTSDSECVAKDSHLNQVVQYGTCTCGYNGGGFTYCTLAEGDKEFIDMKNKFAFIIARSYRCHTRLRFGPCSHLYHDEYLDYQIAAKYFEMYPYLVFNDPCIKKVITWDYWKFVMTGSLAKASYLLLGVVAVILLILT